MRDQAIVSERVKPSFISWFLALIRTSLALASMGLSSSLPPRDCRCSFSSNRCRVCQYVSDFGDFRKSRCIDRGCANITWPQIRIAKVNKTALAMVAENYLLTFSRLDGAPRWQKTCASCVINRSVWCDRRGCSIFTGWFLRIGTIIIEEERVHKRDR